MELKFVYSEKATKFYEISTLLLSIVHKDKSKVKISQNFEAFSEYMNNIKLYKALLSRSYLFLSSLWSVKTLFTKTKNSVLSLNDKNSSKINHDVKG